MKFDIKGYTYCYGAVKGTYTGERAARPSDMQACRQLR